MWFNCPCIVYWCAYRFIEQYNKMYDTVIYKTFYAVE